MYIVYLDIYTLFMTYNFVTAIAVKCVLYKRLLIFKKMVRACLQCVNNHITKYIDSCIIYYVTFLEI